ncbi:hypothetical protein BDW74DRAFT_178357 [Aspergillus multicolor]|uniref:flavin-containing monooxygenase n=1 Tax=Aspergillus multicolor TaxID=41759 RepID=UPI003CCE2B28
MVLGLLSGARFDSESYSYGYSWSPEVLKEWTWSEHFAGQAETLRYSEFVVSKFDLARDMQFDTKVIRAQYQEQSRSWILTDHTGKTYTSRWLVTCIGILNNYTLPDIPGVHDFKGEAIHTARWPRESDSVSFEGKRVGIIGTGATGIQAIQKIVKTAGSLTIFQRTPNWSAPLNNGPIPRNEMEGIRSRYAEIFARCRATYSCFLHRSNPASVFDVSATEREAFWEKLNETRGFEKWLSNYRDVIFTDRKANELYSSFIADKIRARVKDPATAEKLIPRCHGFGTKRVPLESGYFEAYNRPNVELVDVKADPIERVTEKGVKTREKEYGLGILICATGFDAVTGAFTAVHFRGIYGVHLKDKWKDGPRTFLGLWVEDFPNMMMVMGPHQMFGNFPRSIEYVVEWLDNGGQQGPFVKWIRKIATEDIRSVMPKKAAEEASVRYGDEVHKTIVWTGGCKSWYKRNKEGGRVTALFGGSALLFNRLIWELRPEDFEIEYRSANPIRFLGNGFLEYEMDPESDLAWYVEMPEPMRGST